MEKRYIHWEFLVSALIIVASNLGTLIPVFVHLDNKTEARLASHQAEVKELRKEWNEETARFRKEWNEETARFRQEVAQETKDFHGRLIAIEERRKG